MYNEYYLDKRIEGLLRLLSELQIEITSLEAKAINEALNNKYNSSKKYSEELVKLINKYSDKIDKETAKVIIDNNSYMLKTNIDTYKQAIEKGLLVAKPIITSTNKAIIKKRVKYANRKVQSIIKNIQLNSNKQIDILIRDALKQLDNGVAREVITHNVAKELMFNGITIKDSAGKEWHDITAYTRRIVKDISNKCYVDTQEQLAKDIGIPNNKRMIEVSSHLGARPEHASWQGKVYKYDDFVRICKPNTITGIMGINCRHTYYEFIPNVSTRIFRPENIAENERIYKLQQKQRYNESQIRKWKQRAEIKKQLGNDYKLENAKIKYWQTVNKDFVKANNLTRYYEREKI